LVFYKFIDSFLVFHFFGVILCKAQTRFGFFVEGEYQTVEILNSFVFKQVCIIVACLEVFADLDAVVVQEDVFV